MLPDGIHIFEPKIQIWATFGKVLQRKIDAHRYFKAIWYILWSFGTFCGRLVHFAVIWSILWSFGIYFFPFWYVAQRKIWQPRTPMQIGILLHRWNRFCSSRKLSSDGCSKKSSAPCNLIDSKPVFSNTGLPLWMKFAPRGELGPQRWTWSLVGTLYRLEERRGDRGFSPLGRNFAPRGQRLPHGGQLHPWGQISPLGTKLSKGLWNPPRRLHFDVYLKICRFSKT
jgi:hypothetical protein